MKDEGQAPLQAHIDRPDEILAGRQLEELVQRGIIELHRREVFVIDVFGFCHDSLPLADGDLSMQSGADPSIEH